MSLNRQYTSKNRQWVMIAIALGLFVIMIVIGMMNLVKADSARKAEIIANDKGYSLYENDAIRKDIVAQGMLDKIDPELYGGNNESAKERYKRIIYDMGEKDGKKYLLGIYLKDKKVTVIKPMNDKNIKDYYQLLDAVESFQ